MTAAPGVWGIVVAGGTGSRYGSSVGSKLLEMLDGKTVLARSVEALCHVAALSGVVIVTHPGWQAAYREALASAHTHGKPLVWTHGGETRRESVWCGLQALPEDATIVVIHDAARPLVRPERITEALAPVLSGEAQATSLGLPSQNTLKAVESPDTPWVTETLDRQRVWQVHTPQVFRRDVLVRAHQAAPHDIPVNDDAELVERAHPGQPLVRMVADDPWNLKLTTQADRVLAEALLRTLWAYPHESRT